MPQGPAPITQILGELVDICFMRMYFSPSVNQRDGFYLSALVRQLVYGRALLFEH